ncbi:MAG TPA: hypothetical protein VJH94_03535 [Candidatus Paceibacterota bacterium]
MVAGTRTRTARHIGTVATRTILMGTEVMGTPGTTSVARTIRTALPRRDSPSILVEVIGMDIGE